jgi:hypothetical protein
MSKTEMLKELQKITGEFSLNNVSLSEGPDSIVCAFNDGYMTYLGVSYSLALLIQNSKSLPYFNEVYDYMGRTENLIVYKVKR